MEAAALVFLEKGYEAATVADITGRTGGSHGTFYVYFEDDPHGSKGFPYIPRLLFRFHLSWMRINSGRRHVSFVPLFSREFRKSLTLSSMAGLIKE